MGLLTPSENERRRKEEFERRKAERRQQREKERQEQKAARIRQREEARELERQMRHEARLREMEERALQERKDMIVNEVVEYISTGLDTSALLPIIEENGFEPDDILNAASERVKQIYLRKQLSQIITRDNYTSFSIESLDKENVMHVFDCSEDDIKKCIKEISDEIAEIIQQEEQEKRRAEREERHRIQTEEWQATHKLRKGNGFFSGVCAGLGRYWNISPNIFRIVFLLTFSFTWIIYTALAYLMPNDKPEFTD